jgi:hypothetical protein
MELRTLDGVAAETMREYGMIFSVVNWYGSEL